MMGMARLASEYAQESQVGSGFDAFLLSRFAPLDGLLLLLWWICVWWIAVWWRRRPALDGSGCVLVVVGGFGAAAAHCCGFD